MREAQPTKEQKLVVLLPSIHDVMALERILGRQGVFYDLIPVPRQLSSECGMAVESLGSQWRKIDALARDGGIPIEGFYLQKDSGYCVMSAMEG